MIEQSGTKCHFHPERDSVIICQNCGRPMCKECAYTNYWHRPICRPCCVRHFIEQRREGKITLLAICSIVTGLLLCAKAAIPAPALFLMWRIFVPHLAFGTVAGYMIPGVVFLLASGIFLIVSGIDLLRLNDWARRWMVVYVPIAWAAWVVSAGVFFWWLVPAAQEATRTHFGMVEAGASMAIGTAVVAAWGLAYLCTFSQPLVKAQFGNVLKNDVYAGPARTPQA